MVSPFLILMLSLSRVYVPSFGSVIVSVIAALLLALVLPELALLEFPVVLFAAWVPVVVFPAAELLGEPPPQAASARTSKRREVNNSQVAKRGMELKNIGNFSSKFNIIHSKTFFSVRALSNTDE